MIFTWVIWHESCDMTLCGVNSCDIIMLHNCTHNGVWMYWWFGGAIAVVAYPNPPRVGYALKFHFKKYGASHLRLNQTMSPIPRRLRPEPQTQNHIPNRSKSALSSSLSRSTPHLAQTLPARGSVSSSPSPNRRQSTTRTIQRPDNSDLDYRGPSSRRSTPGGLKSAKSTSNLSRLSSSENSRKPYDSTRRRLKLKQSNDVRIRLS